MCSSRNKVYFFAFSWTSVDLKLEFSKKSRHKPCTYIFSPLIIFICYQKLSESGRVTLDYVLDMWFADSLPALRHFLTSKRLPVAWIYTKTVYVIHTPGWCIVMYDLELKSGLKLLLNIYSFPHFPNCLLGKT